MNVAKRKLLILIKNSIACGCVSHKLLMSENYRRMTYQIFEAKFLWEKIIVERREMAHSIRLEKLSHNRQ